MKDLFAEIERVLPEGGDWCGLDRANVLAALVVALRPKVVLEIGIWQGGSLVPMLLALKKNGTGRAIAVDPWDHQASIADEEPANVKWWGDIGQQGHEDAYRAFMSRLAKHELTGICEVWRKRSDDCTPPQTIDILSVDGNHTDQAVRDVERYGRNVRIGGIMILDDLHWSSGGVARAKTAAHVLGFIDMYPLGSGIVMQRTDPE